jgi:replicative DNA helicase
VLREGDAVQIIPPQNLQAEEAVLGAIVMENALLRKTTLAADDFYPPNHRRYFAAFLELWEKNIPVDLISLGQKLPEEDLVVISGYMAAHVTSANFSYHQDLVKELSRRRQIQKICLESLGAIQDLPAEEAAQQIRARIGGVFSGRETGLVPISRVVHETYSFAERRCEDRGNISGVPSGLKDLDRVTDGFQGGDLIILAGRPGTGKSALAMHVAHEAAKGNYPAGFISLEMGEHQIGIRSLASFSRVPMWRLRKGFLNSEHWEKLSPGANSLSALPIWFSFSAMDSKSINSAINAMAEEKGCRIVFLDYLQLAKAKEAKSREREVAEISLLCKNAARSLNIPVVALAQLNRLVEREKRKPVLSDLRDSGAIEQDADVVMFLHKGPEEEGTVTLVVAKGRNLGTGEFKVTFDPELMTFRDYSERKD